MVRDPADISDRPCWAATSTAVSMESVPWPTSTGCPVVTRSLSVQPPVRLASRLSLSEGLASRSFRYPRSSLVTAHRSCALSAAAGPTFLAAVDTPTTSWSRPPRSEASLMCPLGLALAGGSVSGVVTGAPPPAEPPPSRRSDYQDLTEEELAAGFAAGDEQYLEAVFRRWSSLIYTVALRTRDSSSEAQDVTPQVFGAAWRGWMQCRSSGGSLA